jgi:lipopolysaccharide transport system permease protein
MDSNATHLPPNIDGLPHPNQIFTWAEEATQKQQWPIAALRWAVLRHAYPDHPAPWFQGINAHIQECELDKAEHLLIHAQQYFPSHPNTLLLSAELAIHKEEWDAAEDLLGKARDQHPNELLSWMKSAEFARQRGDLRRAETYYQHAIQLTPDRPGPLIEYAELSMQTQRWEEALKRWESVRKLYPNLSAGYLRAAEAARQLARPQESRHLTLSYQYGPDLFVDSRDSPNHAQRSKYGNTFLLLDLIWTKTIFNLRSEVQRNYLSYGWWILEPMLHMMVYYIVFGVLLERGGGSYSVFLLTGLIPWMWFMKSVSSSSNSIIHGQHLLMQVGIPSVVLPLVNILQSTLKQIPIFLLLFGFVWLQGYSPGSHWWALLAVISIQFLLTATFACAVAALIPFIRDLAYLVPTGLTFLMFLSGIFYDYRNIAPEFQELFLMNPIALLLTNYRDIIMDSGHPNLAPLMWWGLGSGAAFLLLLGTYKRLRYVYPRIVME